jgi:prefoldin subunit 5
MAAEGGSDVAEKWRAAAMPKATDDGPQLFTPTDASKRGIPEAIFIENVEQMCKEYDSKVVVAKLQELYSKYQYMQSSLVAQRASLKAKLPDIMSALETVNHLLERRTAAEEGGGEEKEYTYQLSENIYSRAKVAPTNVVCLWLGANCMLEYTLDEAVSLLSTNESNAKTTLKTLEEDIRFLRDQITTTEVNIARAHNYGVKLRQSQKPDGAEARDTSTPAQKQKNADPAEKPVQHSGSASDGSYSWKQEPDETELIIKVPVGTKKGDVKVKILAESICVYAAEKVVLEKELAGKCSPSSSTWTMNNDRIELTLTKAEPGFWPTLFAE